METEVIRISLKNADNILSNNYWKIVFEDIITYEVTNNIKAPDYITDLEKDIYDEIWTDLLSDNDKNLLFGDEKNEYYFWIHNLSDDYFEKYIDLLEKGRDLTSIVQEEINSEEISDELSDLDKNYIQTDDLYEKHLANEKLVTVTSTDQAMVISCMNKKILDETKNSLILTGYIIYDERNKVIDSKTLYSYVYEYKKSTLPFCPN